VARGPNVARDTILSGPRTHLVIVHNLARVRKFIQEYLFALNILYKVLTCDMTTDCAHSMIGRVNRNGSLTITNVMSAIVKTPDGLFYSCFQSIPQPVSSVWIRTQSTEICSATARCDGLILQ